MKCDLKDCDFHSEDDECFRVDYNTCPYFQTRKTVYGFIGQCRICSVGDCDGLDILKEDK